MNRQFYETRVQIEEKFTRAATAAPRNIAAELDDLIRWASARPDGGAATIDVLWPSTVSAVLFLGLDDQWLNSQLLELSFDGGFLLFMMLEHLHDGRDGAIRETLGDVRDALRNRREADECILAGLAELALTLRIHLRGWTDNS